MKLYATLYYKPEKLLQIEKYLKIDETVIKAMAISECFCSCKWIYRKNNFDLCILEKKYAYFSSPIMLLNCIDFKVYVKLTPYFEYSYISS